MQKVFCKKKLCHIKEKLYIPAYIIKKLYYLERRQYNYCLLKAGFRTRQIMKNGFFVLFPSFAIILPVITVYYY